MFSSSSSSRRLATIWDTQTTQTPSSKLVRLRLVICCAFCLCFVQMLSKILDGRPIRTMMTTMVTKTGTENTNFRNSGSINSSSSNNNRPIQPEATTTGLLDPDEAQSLRHHLSMHYTMKELTPMFRLWTMVSPDHFDLAVHAIERVNQFNVSGDVVECGVWKGGMSMAMAVANQKDNTERHFYLFDTFEGLPEPSEKDDARAKAIWNQVHSGVNINKQKTPHRAEDGKWNYGPKPIVMNNMFYTGYPPDKIHFIQGKVEDTLPKTKLPDKIAILRLDTDWYESTKIELEYMWDRLVVGGLLIVDDFCSWGGARKATTEFFAALKEGMNATEISKERPCLHYWKK